jgi:uncharacterized protein (DUF2062 family)
MNNPLTQTVLLQFSYKLNILLTQTVLLQFSYPTEKSPDTNRSPAVQLPI